MTESTRLFWWTWRGGEAYSVQGHSCMSECHHRWKLGEDSFSTHSFNIYQIDIWQMIFSQAQWGGFGVSVNEAAFDGAFALPYEIGIEQTIKKLLFGCNQNIVDHLLDVSKWFHPCCPFNQSIVDLMNSLDIYAVSYNLKASTNSLKWAQSTIGP